MRKLLMITAIIAAGLYGNNWYKEHQRHRTEQVADFAGSPASPNPRRSASDGTRQMASPDVRQEVSSSNFHCDGRTHCSQMTSCEEAAFFLKNCPNVKMDGDGDGIPCEHQWCNSY